jgi:hypothetical protein
MNRLKTESLLQSNPLSEWLDSRLVVKPGVITRIGVARKQRITEIDPTDAARSISADGYENSDIWLYANYVDFAAPSGIKPVSVKRFGALLVDLCHDQLGLAVKAGRDRQSAFIEGLAIRGPLDESASPISVSLALATTSLETSPVVDCGGLCPECGGCVVAETLGSGRCGGCGGLFNLSHVREKIESLDLESDQSEYINKFKKPTTSTESTAGGTSSHHASTTDTLQSTTNDNAGVNSKSLAKFHPGDVVRYSGQNRLFKCLNGQKLTVTSEQQADGYISVKPEKGLDQTVPATHLSLVRRQSA